MDLENSINGDLKMKLLTQFTVLKKDFKESVFRKKGSVLEKIYKKKCVDYPNEKNCLVCCK